MKNFILKFLDSIRDIFETATPSVFAALAAILPYASPIPIAVYTASKAQQYLGFDGTVAGIFVFVLEGLGVWVTATLVEAIVDFIRSRNGKTIFMVLFLGGVVGVYLFILVQLNVRLESALGALDSELASIITLICFLPALSGAMNGVWKLRLEHKDEVQSEKSKEDEKYWKRQDELNARWRLKHGYTLETDGSVITQENTQPKSVKSVKRFNFKKDEGKLHKDRNFILNASVGDVQEKYGVSRKTVYNWRERLEG